MSCIIKTGKTSQSFKLERRTKQEILFLAYLFILVFEISFFCAWNKTRISKESSYLKKSFHLQVLKQINLNLNIWDWYSNKGSGYTLQYEICDSKRKYDKNYRNLLKLWNLRNLTFEGRIAVSKTLALSKIIHLAPVKTISSGAIDQLKNIQKDFIWNKTKPKIKTIFFV